MTVGVGAGAIAACAPLCLPSRRLSLPSVRQRPLFFAVAPFKDLLGSLKPDVVELVRHRLRLGSEFPFSGLLHWLRTFGDKRMPLHDAASTNQIMSLLTDTQRLALRFGDEGVVVPTQDGIRYLSHRSPSELSKKGRPAHAHQELAVFGEIGVAASTEIRTHAGRFTLCDAVNDCARNVQLREATRLEPEWTTQALLHYLPPATEWRNRWGETVSFEAWARFLVERDLPSYGCYGTHLLCTLALLLQANQHFRIISDDLVGRVESVCGQYKNLLETTQHDDGSWRGDWAGSQQKVSNHEAVHMTGHILESQMYVPARLRLSDGRAGRAIARLAEAFVQSTDVDATIHYCPFSHAGRVLLLSAHFTQASRT